jgi:hypothetical protein
MVESKVEFATAKRKKALNKEEQKAKSAQQNANKVVSEIKKQNEADVEKRKKSSILYHVEEQSHLLL